MLTKTRQVDLLAHTDHLNTPRLVADSTGTTVWRWDQAEPFGATPANDDPDGNSVVFDLPLRLPGQRYDKETGAHQKVSRDYQPELGAYLQPEPLGLLVEINPYRYVYSDPLRVIDLDGRAPKMMIGRAASYGISATVPIPVLPFLSVSGGAGFTIRQCCDSNGKIFNELLWTVRFGVGTGISAQASASGRGVAPLVQFGGFPMCSPPVDTRDPFASFEGVGGVFSGRYDRLNSVTNVGFSGGYGLSLVANIFERVVVIAVSPTGLCCKP